MMQKVRMSYFEKVKMYTLVEKNELIEMLIEATNAIDRIAPKEKLYELIQESVSEGSSATVFYMTKKYPRVVLSSNDADDRLVEIEIETYKPLSDEFFNKLTSLILADLNSL